MDNWISVKDRLPERMVLVERKDNVFGEDSAPVLVCTLNGSVMVAELFYSLSKDIFGKEYWVPTGWFFYHWDEDFGTGEEVTHWQELPRAPIKEIV